MRLVLALCLASGLYAGDAVLPLPSVIPKDAPVTLIVQDVPRLVTHFLASPLAQLYARPWAIHAVDKLTRNMTEAASHLPLHRVLLSLQAVSVGIDLDRQGQPVMLAEASLADPLAMGTLLTASADRLQDRPGMPVRWIAQQFSVERHEKTWVLAVGDTAMEYQPGVHPVLPSVVADADIGLKIDVQNAMGTRSLIGPLHGDVVPAGAPIITGIVRATPEGLTERWLLPTAPPTTTDGGITRVDFARFPIDTISAAIMRTAGPDLATALERSGFTKTSGAEVVNNQLSAAGLPALIPFLRGITGDLVLCIGEGVPLPTITISMQMEPTLATTLAKRFANALGLVATADPQVFFGKLNPIMPVQVSSMNGRFLATTLAGGAAQWDNRMGGFLERPEIAAQVAAMRFQGTTIASLSRSSEFWALLAALTATQIQQAGIPNVIDIPGDVRALALGGYFEAVQTQRGLEVSARGLLGGPMSMYSLMGASGGYVTLRDMFINMANRKISREQVKKASPYAQPPAKTP